jgi:hypothetical protein
MEQEINKQKSTLFGVVIIESSVNLFVSQLSQDDYLPFHSLPFPLFLYVAGRGLPKLAWGLNPIPTTAW